MSDFKRVVIDADWVIYGAGFAGEKRVIKAIHTPSGREYDAKNRTEFWGRKKSKDGGMLEELNKSTDSPMTWDEFEIVDIQQPEPLENVLYTAKRMIEGVSKETGVEKRILCVGQGKSFRHQRSTILEYKANRAGALLPVYKEEIKDYLLKVHKAILVDGDKEGLETDDMVIILGQEEGTVVASVDKDTAGNPVHWFNPNHPEWGIQDCRGLGKLWWDTSGKTKILRGIGRKFFYAQLLKGDMTDNYKPNAASEVEFGEVATFEALNECKTDLECFKAIKQAYQTMYPEPVRVHGWRAGLTQGCENIITVDWLYALNEVWDLARMKRSIDDNVTASEVFRKYGLLDD